MSPAISVVIPVYNVSAYLPALLDILFRQKFRDFEVIAVNDGSTDDSLRILQAYAAQDRRLHIIDKPNSGVSDTRNTGIAAACGEYLCCVDADDLLSPDYLLAMHTLAEREKADMVVCGYQTFRGTISFRDSNTADVHRVTDAQELLTTGLMTSACTKMIRLDLIRQHNIGFRPDMTFGEDLFFCWKAFITAQNVWLTDQQLYGYRLSGNSAINRFHPSLYEKYKVAFSELKAFHASLKPEDNAVCHEMDVFFTQRLPSFLMMTIREKSSIATKYQRLQHILRDDTIQTVLQSDDQALPSTGSSATLFRHAKKHQVFLLLLSGYKLEARHALSRLKGKLVKHS